MTLGRVEGGNNDLLGAAYLGHIGQHPRNAAQLRDVPQRPLAVGAAF
jgi:hypothetical protein